MHLQYVCIYKKTQVWTHTHSSGPHCSRVSCTLLLLSLSTERTRQFVLLSSQRVSEHLIPSHTNGNPTHVPSPLHRLPWQTSDSLTALLTRTHGHVAGGPAAERTDRTAGPHWPRGRRFLCRGPDAMDCRLSGHTPAHDSGPSSRPGSGRGRHVNHTAWRASSEISLMDIKMRISCNFNLS